MIAGEREEWLKGLNFTFKKNCTKFCLFQAIWENQFYYLFGFLFLVFIILVVSCSQISIVMVYFQLCAEVRYLGNGAMNTFVWLSREKMHMEGQALLSQQEKQKLLHVPIALLVSLCVIRSYQEQLHTSSFHKFFYKAFNSSKQLSLSVYTLAE